MKVIECLHGRKKKAGIRNQESVSAVLYGGLECTLRKGMNQHNSRNIIKRNCRSLLQGSSKTTDSVPLKCLLLFPTPAS